MVLNLFVKEILEVLLLAFTVFAESSSETYIGKKAVASVIKERVEQRHSTYYKEITKPKQFSCYNSLEEILKHILRLEEKSFRACFKASIEVYYGDSIFKGVLYYTRIDVKTVWMDDMKIVKIIGNHKFMKEM